MASGIGDSIKNAVENAAHAVEEAVETVKDKVTGHSDDDANETTVTDGAPVTAPAEPAPVVVETEAISEPLSFERIGTDGTPVKLDFEPADDSRSTEHHTTTD